jgi:gas vesicle protein
MDYQEVNMRKFGYFLLGAFVGGIVGSTFALLFAPFSGEGLRSQIKEVTLKTVDDVRSAASQKRIQLEKQLSDLRKPAPES